MTRQLQAGHSGNIPGARGGKASVEPAPAAASSSSSSSRFSSSPGAKIFLMAKKQKLVNFLVLFLDS